MAEKLELAHDGDDLAENRHLVRSEDHELECWVFGLEDDFSG